MIKNKVLLPKTDVNKGKHWRLKTITSTNQFIIRVQKRDELKKFLTENEIGK